MLRHGHGSASPNQAFYKQSTVVARELRQTQGARFSALKIIHSPINLAIIIDPFSIVFLRPSSCLSH
jgi:hypothetical protein